MRPPRPVIWTLWLGLAACSEAPTTNDTTDSSGPPSVYVVNYPLRYFAERIGGDRVEVEFPAPEEGDPAFWSPDDEAIRSFQEADLILLNGAGYADWVDRVSLPEMRCVDTSRGFEDRFISIEEAVTHSHGPEGDHSHTGIAFTTWLDLSLAAEQSAAIRDAFARAWPQHEAEFAERAQRLEQDLLELDAALRDAAGPPPGAPLLGSHPVYQYLTRRYGLNLRSVHWEPDVVPDAEQWSELQTLLAEHPATWMLWEGDPIPETVKGLDTLAVKSVVFDPCGNTPGSGDFLDAMRRNLENLRGALVR